LREDLPGFVELPSSTTPNYSFRIEATLQNAPRISNGTALTELAG